MVLYLHSPNTPSWFVAQLNKKSTAATLPFTFVVWSVDDHNRRSSAKATYVHHSFADWHPFNVKTGHYAAPRQ
jgi:hypothetical protein